MSQQTLAWGILGAGSIARAFANGIKQCTTGRLLAVASRSQEKADKFAAEYGIERRYAGYEQLLADKDVQAVYVCLPHPMHAEWVIRAAEAGKHVLCEKPFAVNHAEAMAMIEAAALNNVFLMEAFMYRCHPQTAKLVELIRQGAIGQVRVIQATFSFQAGFHAESRLWNNDLAGGGIMDVGCYAVSMSRLLAGAAAGKDFADPIAVTGAGHLNETTGVDEYAIGTLRFPGDIVASIATGVGLNQENAVRVFGTGGSIYLPNPWVASREGTSGGKIILRASGKEPQEIVLDSPVTSFALEIDVVGRAVAEGKRQASAPAMSWGDTLGNIRTLDQWRHAVGLTYNMEKPANVLHTVSRRALEVRPGNNMKYGHVDYVNKPISRLVMGVDNQHSMPHAAVMFDDFFARGGNCFDCAFIYGGGICERLLGQWVKNRGLRDKVVLLDKGCHTPFCDPKSLTDQLMQSLERLQTDYLDLYVMHRDNPEIAVGEFIDVLNEHVRAGRIKAFGGSNWSIERVQKANAYAKRKGLQGMSVVSNNFSLARMVDPVWGGCIAASDADSRAWLKRHQMPLFPWSSQARGFFTDRAAPDKQEDKELVRCWYSDDNFQRKARAQELASKKGVLPIQIALAYVLCQPFPTFPLIGPRQLSETRSSFAALDVDLSAKELKWLNLEA